MNVYHHMAHLFNQKNKQFFAGNLGFCYFKHTLGPFSDLKQRINIKITQALFNCQLWHFESRLPSILLHLRSYHYLSTRGHYFIWNSKYFERLDKSWRKYLCFWHRLIIVYYIIIFNYNYIMSMVFEHYLNRVTVGRTWQLFDLKLLNLQSLWDKKYTEWFI